jgi:hypothetical protein
VTAFSDTVEPEDTPFTARALVLFAATCPTSMSAPPLVTYTFTSCESVLLTLSDTPLDGVTPVPTSTFRDPHAPTTITSRTASKLLMDYSPLKEPAGERMTSACARPL